MSICGAIAIGALCIAPSTTIGQVQVREEWRVIDHPEDRPGYGEWFQLNQPDDPETPATYTPQPYPNGTQTQDESAEDWNYAHVNVYDPVTHKHIGYAVAGYSHMRNWGAVDPFDCHTFNGPGPVPEANLLETREERRSAPFATVGLYDLNGNKQWLKLVMPGTFYSLIQDAEGNLVAIGEASVNYTRLPRAVSDVMHYNPTGINDVDISQVPCGSVDFPSNSFTIKMALAKLDLTGNVTWVNTYGLQDPLPTAWPVFSRGQDLVDLVINGQNGYMAVGYGRSAAGANDNVGYALRIRSDGVLVDMRTYAPNDADLNNQNVGFANEPGTTIRFYAVDRVDDNGVQRVAISGVHQDPAKAFLLHLRPDQGSVFGVDWYAYTRDQWLELFHVSTKEQMTSGVTFAHEDNGVSIVWPVLANYNGATYAGPKSATLIIHKYNVDGDPLWAPPQILDAPGDEARAYDLQAEVCQTKDGNIAFITSAWDFPQPFWLPSVTPVQQQCLTDRFSYDTDPWQPGTQPFPWNTNIIEWGYWNTDAFVGKVKLSDGGLLWKKKFDATPEEGPVCTPGDLKQQECMYKITEADAGGLVVSGNTSHNRDDCYLVKLSADCHALADYSAFDVLPLASTGQDEHTLIFDQTWYADMNVHGRVRIPAGRTLTISGATIRFADSQLLEHPTGIIIEPGGTLRLEGGATLSGLPSCNEEPRMWDGVIVQGDPTESQEGNGHPHQGLLDMRSATIEHARTGALVAQEIPAAWSLSGLQAVASGGIVRIYDGRFLNCKRDVVLSPYENHVPGQPQDILANKCRFNLTSFAVDAVLNDGTAPLEHVWLNGVRNIPFQGCSFRGLPLNDPDMPVSSDIGTGIRAINSSFMVNDHCSFNGNYGDPCPPENITQSTFDQLRRGIIATNLDPSKTCAVDHAIFTRCPASIRLDAMDNAGLTRNAIDVTDLLNPFVFGTPFGIYMDECTGYEVEDNVLTAQSTTARARAGIVIKNSGPFSNRVYNNQLDGFGYKNSTALLIQGTNADPGDNYLTGLEVKCNDFGQTGAKNAYDVALTAINPTLRANQGSVFSNLTDYTAPAGNRFSLLGATESDWHVQNTSNFVVYYHHDGFSEPWIPQDYDLAFLDPEGAQGDWPPNRSQACPSNQRSRERERSAMMAGSEEKSEGLVDSRSAYDATLDNGDTYSLLGYVGDPTKTSTQVRNALQSVAPNVSVEVWQAAFDRSPTMNAWNLTQALLSNSPLQPEVIKLCYESELSDFYYNLVASAQSGINPLDILESDISTYATGKAEDLTDLGRWSWLDSTNVDSVITLLKIWHDQLPADNGDAVLAGYYAAKGDNVALYDLAAALEQASKTPGVYGVLKHYANAQQTDGWTRPDVATSTYLTGLAQDRWVLGSARAGTWLNALGEEPLEEVVILPLDERAIEVRKRVRNTSSQEAVILEAYPNPTDGLAYVVCNVPEGVDNALVVVHDLSGRVLQQQKVGVGTALVELNLFGEPSGVYATELRIGGVRVGTVKVTVN